MEKSYRLLNLWKPFSRCYGNDSVIKVLGCNVASSRGSRCSHSSVTASKNIRAQFGGRHTVSLLTGDGVGPELLSHVQQVFRYAGAPIDFEEVEISSQKNEPSVMKNALLSVARNGVAIKGNIDTHHDVPTFKSMNLELRLQLDLFANVVHCKTIPSVNVRHKNIDIVLIRENVEGEYSQLAHENVPGVVESLKIITEEKSTRIAKYAFDYALKHGRKQVTAVHKANIMKLGDGLFLECCRKVAALYPGIKFNDMIVDNCSMQMVSRPGQFDVMVLPNLYGNILVNIAAGLIGGAGVVAGANFGENYAVFEAGTRQSGRSMKGKNIANPIGILMASCDLLDYLGHHQHAEVIRDSVMSVLTEQQVCTPDLGGQSTTTDVIQAIIDDIKPKTATRYSNA